MRRTLIAIAIAAAVAVPSIGQAKSFRWAAQGDILTFDPHSQNEGMTIAANSYIYEPLVDYDKDFKVVPRLATEWEQVSPTLYRFKLRPGVKFHDGAAFTADDVTAYYEVVPANHLQRILFAEADRMGSLVVDEANFASERDVVKEELRQNLSLIHI